MDLRISIGFVNSLVLLDVYSCTLGLIQYRKGNIVQVIICVEVLVEDFPKKFLD